MKKKELIINDLPYVSLLLKTFFDDFDDSVIETHLNKTQQKTMLMLDQNQNKTMSELSRYAGLELGSFTSVIDKLIEEKLVNRERDSEDRRKVIVCTTKKGKEISEKIRNALNKHILKKLEVLPDTDFKDFLEALQIIKRIAIKLNNK